MANAGVVNVLHHFGLVAGTSSLHRFFFGTTFTATMQPDSRHCARHTVPNPPCPKTVLSIWYSSAKRDMTSSQTNDENPTLQGLDDRLTLRWKAPEGRRSIALGRENA